MQTDYELLDNFRRNVEIERKKRNISQSDWADMIGMSLSSYRRMINGEMQLSAGLVMKNLYLVTGLCCYELMEVYDPYLTVKSKLGRLTPEQLRHVEMIIDYELKKEPI